MKETNRIWYLCDPQKNTACPKTYCMFSGVQNGCFQTSHSECAEMDQNGNPVVFTTREESQKEKSKHQRKKKTVTIKENTLLFVIAILAAMLKGIGIESAEIKATGEYHLRVKQEGVMDAPTDHVPSSQHKILLRFPRKHSIEL